MSEENVKIDNESAQMLKNTIIEIETAYKQIEIIRAQVSESIRFAKGKGFEPKMIKKILKLRKLDEKRKEELEHEEDVAKFLESKVYEMENKDADSTLINNA
jgi:uncharacterized protein (UPF0335 family)